MKALLKNININFLSCFLLLSMPLYALPPEARDVKISPAGPYIPGQLVTGGYTYYDAEGDPQSGTVIGFYRSDSPTGTGYSLIASGSSTYNVSSTLRGKYIAFGVTPDNAVDPPGTLTFSSWELVNTLPVAIEDEYSVTEGETLTVAAPGILSNDINLDLAQILEAIRTSNPVNGTISSFLSTGAFTYVHNGGENLSDVFEYEVTDGLEASLTTAKINIAIAPDNDPPDLGAIETTILQYTEDNPGTRVTTTITITDPDDTYLNSASVFFSSGYVNTEDSLYLKSNLFTSSFNKTTGVLSINGERLRTQYRDSALRRVMYVNTNHDNPVNSPDRVVSFTVFDGDDYSDTVSRTIHINRVNDPPVATDAHIDGTYSPFRTKELLTADYTYSDPDGNPESGTTIAWLTSATSSGASPTVVRNYATQDTFKTRFDDGGRYIAVVVLPRDNQGTTGDDDTSTWYYINDEPQLEGLTIVNRLNPGGIAVGQTVSADYTYFDLETNPSGSHTFQWYRANSNSWTAASPLSGETDSTYTIEADDKNRWIGIEAYPYATAGSSPGQRTRSSLIQVGSLPTAVLSGSDTICNNGDTAILTVTLTGDNEPWAIKYTRNGANETTVTGIEETPYSLKVTQAGTYALTEVSDEKYDKGTVSGTGRVVLYTHPTATLTQDTVFICPGDGDIYSYPVVLTGKQPWNISIQKEGRTDSVMVNGITESPYLEEVILSDSGTYQVLHVWDRNCMSEGTGSTVVAKKTSPVAVMSGDTTVCPGQAAVLPVELSGDGPWTIYYTRNGGSEVSVYVNQNVSEYTYNLSVTQVGTYAITRVVDQEDEGCASGGAIVQNYTLPTAVFTEGSEVCEELNNKIKITLTGVSPWTLSYRYESGSPVTVSNILTSPHTIPVANTGTYSLVTVGDKNCTTTTTGTQEIVPAPAVAIGEVDTVLFTGNPPITVNVNPLGGNFLESDYPAALIYGSGNWTFWQALAYTYYGSPFMIRYAYQDPGTTCVGKDSIQILITNQPCDIQIQNDKDMFCSNDGLITVYGINIDHSIGTFTISAPGTGLVNAGNNTAYLDPSIIKSGSRTVTYTASIGGNPTSVQKVVNFNHVVADFSWDNECFSGESLVNFSDKSTSTPNSVSGYQWNIYVPGDTITSYNPQTSYTFINQSTYPVELIASSQYISTDDTSYCYGTIRKDLILKPTFEVDGLPYLEDFTSDNTWFSFPENGLNSWTYGVPPANIFNTTKGNAWYTNVSSADAENSYVISPCFDFSDSKRPMIKMDIWRKFTATQETQFDGAVLQYTTNNGLTWSRIGTLDDGIEWYNSISIEGQPGDQNIGWAAVQDGEWMEARHKLDELNSKTNVRFRIAYGAPQYNKGSGIAFDNFWVGERSKKVLIEHFTNAGSAECKTVNENFNSVLNDLQNKNDIIDLQFHTEYPGVDTFYTLNPTPPLSREQYYGISTNIPYSIIDGGRGNQGVYIIDYSMQEELVQNDLTLAVLDENKFNIDLQTVKDGNSIDIDITLTARVALPETDLTLNTVIIENIITGVTGDNGETSFESVVKDMLPGAQGIGFSRSWSVGASEEVSLHYDYENVFDEEELRVVVFIQANDETREVYQAEIMDPNIFDPIGLIEETPAGFRIYPNPTRESASVRFDRIPVTRTRIDIINFNGSLVNSAIVYPGQELVDLRLDNYLPGIYMIRVSDNKRILGTKKLIISGNK